MKLKHIILTGHISNVEIVLWGDKNKDCLQTSSSVMHK